VLLCTFEDRAHHLVALRLLAHSLGRACPGQRLGVWCPPPLVEPFRAGLPEQVDVHAWSRGDVTGWSVKPSLLLDRLDEGHEEAVWLDSDIIVAGEFRDRFDRSGSLVVAAEPHWVTRTTALTGARNGSSGAPRRFDGLVNSCVVRARPPHRPLLDAWQRRLASAEFRAAQRLDFGERPAHLRGDQDVLDALLASPPFADMPVHLLRPGEDIVQCHMADGFSVRDRIRHAWRQLPPLVHSEGFKPWDDDRPSHVFLDVSPYVLLAQRYTDVLDGEPRWLHPVSMWGRVLRRLTREEPSAAGLVPAALTEIQRALRLRTRLASVFERPSPVDRMPPPVQR
jgi:hypothetical protein